MTHENFTPHGFAYGANSLNDHYNLQTTSDQMGNF